MPVAAETLIAACPTSSEVMPAATNLPKRSLHLSAMRKPMKAKAAKPRTTSSTPSKPSSSPIIERIMSVWASGR